MWKLKKTEWKLHLCCCCSTMSSSAHPMADGPETSRSFSGNTREAPFRKSLQIPQVEQCNQRGSLARADDPEAIDPTMVRQTGLVQKPINLVHFWKWGGRRSSWLQMCCTAWRGTLMCNLHSIADGRITLPTDRDGPWRSALGPRSSTMGAAGLGANRLDGGPGLLGRTNEQNEDASIKLIYRMSGY